MQRLGTRIASVFAVLAAALGKRFVLPVPALRLAHGVKPFSENGRRIQKLRLAHSWSCA